MTLLKQREVQTETVERKRLENELIKMQLKARPTTCKLFCISDYFPSM